MKMSSVFWMAPLVLGGCFSVGRTVPIVSAADSPKPPSGESWHCFTQQTGSERPSSTCVRDVDVCQKASSAVDGMVILGITTKAGKCAPQPSAFCRYVWFPEDKNNTHECFKSRADCEEDAIHRIDNATRQSACQKA